MKRIAIAIVLSLAFAGTASAADGKSIYGLKCTPCHGADGKGQGPMGKKLGVRDLTATPMSAADIEQIVTKGKGKMTPYEGKLTAEEIKAVAAYVKGGLK